MIYSTQNISIRVEPQAEPPNNVGIAIGRLGDAKRTNGSVFIPCTDLGGARIKQGMNPDLSMDLLEEDLPCIRRREASDEKLCLILSSLLEPGEGRGTIYALKDRYHAYVAKVRCGAPRRHWQEIMVAANPVDAFYITWKANGELVANELIYIDERMTVHAMSQEQAYLQFTAMGLDKVPFHFNVKEGHRKARLLMTEWYKVK